MKPKYIIIAILALVTLVTVSSFAYSTKEKSPTVLIVDNDTGFDLGLVYPYTNLPDYNLHAMTPVAWKFVEIKFYNDPYLVRSQKWIRDRNQNLQAIKTEANRTKKLKSVERLC